MRRSMSSCVSLALVAMLVMGCQGLTANMEPAKGEKTKTTCTDAGEEMHCFYMTLSALVGLVRQPCRKPTLEK